MFKGSSTTASLIAYYSLDGGSWVQFGSEAHSAYIYPQLELFQ